MRTNFCIMCTPGEQEPDPTICYQCFLWIHAYHCSTSDTVLFCRACIDNLWHKPGEVNPISVLCLSCHSALFAHRKSVGLPVELFKPGKVEWEKLYGGTVVKQVKEGYLVEVDGFTKYGFLITSKSLTPGATVALFYGGQQEGKHYFALVNSSTSDE